LKAKIRNLQERVERIGQKPETESAEWRARAEAKACQAWIVKHLTEDERTDLARRFAPSEKIDGSTPIDDEMHRILSKGEERAGAEPANAWEEFKQKWVRAETLRRAGRLLTKGEGDELRALNAWMDNSSDAIALKLHPACLTG